MKAIITYVNGWVDTLEGKRIDIDFTEEGTWVRATKPNLGCSEVTSSIKLDEYVVNVVIHE